MLNVISLQTSTLKHDHSCKPLHFIVDHATNFTPKFIYLEIKATFILCSLFIRLSVISCVIFTHLQFSEEHPFLNPVTEKDSVLVQTF